MRRILLSCVTLATLVLFAAASANARARAESPGFLVVQKAVGDGVHGHPMVTLVIEGFVLGRVSPKAEARVDIYQSPAAGDQGGSTAVGEDVSSHPVRWHGFAGKEYNGTGFRFRATDGAYRVVIRGSGVYLFAGGHGSVKLRGSSVYKNSDGKYSVDGKDWRSLPTRVVTRKIGGG